MQLIFIGIIVLVENFQLKSKGQGCYEVGTSGVYFTMPNSIIQLPYE